MRRIQSRVYLLNIVSSQIAMEFQGAASFCVAARGLRDGYI
jgi:hypothetical protein